MSLSTLFQRFRLPMGRRPGAEPVVNTPADVEAARTLARRRLIGMLVLVGVGMVVFPMFLETKPRPVASDVTVRVAAPTSDLVSAAPSAAGPVRVAPTPSPVQVLPPAVVGDAAQDDTVQQPVSPAPKPAAAPVPAASVKPAETPRPVAKVPAKAEDKPAPVSRPAEVASNERYVVQFGAFADPKSARDARMKLERLGIKTYAQQVDTPDGKRTRVRMGPYTSRAEADKALSALRKAGLDGKVLTL